MAPHMARGQRDLCACHNTHINLFLVQGMKGTRRLQWADGKDALSYSLRFGIRDVQNVQGEIVFGSYFHR